MPAHIVRTVLIHDANGTPTLVTVSDHCPVCGWPRDEPILNYGTHIWTNRCGHVDTDESILTEAQQMDRGLGIPSL